MADVFLYGTLRHLPLLQVVLGRSVDRLVAVPAMLPDHAVFWAGHEPFAMLDPAPGERAGGLLVTGLTGTEIDRLDYYLGSFEHSPADAVPEVDGVRRPARVYLPPPGRWKPGPVWSLADWVGRWAAISLRAAEEIMAHQGRLSAAEIAARHYPIRVRAAQLVRAEGRDSRDDPARPPARDVLVQARHRPYLNFFGLEELDLQFRRFDGTLSPVVNRAALRVGDAAVVLPYDPVADCVLLVQQFRPAAFIAGDRAPWLWEAPAGLVDPGEDPPQAAFREAEEEARVTLTRLEPVTEAYSTTGSSTEYAHIYVGIADLSRAGAVAGLESEGEDIRSEVIAFDDFMAGIGAGRYVNLHLATAAFWLALNRDRLRAT